MEEDTSRGNSKRRKTNDNSNANYTLLPKNINWLSGNDASNNHSKQLPQQNEKAKKNVLSASSRNNSQNLSHVNTKSNANQDVSYPSMKRNSSNIQLNNSKRNCTSDLSKDQGHPFLKRYPGRSIYVDHGEMRNYANQHSKIFLKNSLKNTYADNTGRNRNPKQKQNKVGLSSNEYTNYKVTTENTTSYDHAKKLNYMWNIYVDELLSLTNTEELPQDTINDMELNGAEIEIHKSRCASYIGIKGIIILETQNAFKIVTPKNKVLIVLKNKTVFILTIKDKQYYLHGVQLLRDPALKSSKKYKVLQNRAI
ncbi:ribonuclease P protein subunit p29, putative [Plasmodium knowlesi strain H]|uniref:Ribonuclease P protein subunit p29, putative n=3 Tax=Plasmodium knowlesi TaxID=5850 RepID=A0A1A7VYQ5_PLAKH|nr:ribonuclease P protein subunit p29, putative [Plasmodium knowlesi strain H]OTN64755.1 putative Ribonuclease P protein subunit p29 [Plasmodium knowlesi]CAA9989047.1 ribonuclease P protein subunit p29, putative [Plasmodium knowlesi strain H]SBO27258.1 ribonuclease P protein subunit p29, putative [Plasmodium knowlesi strain H]SBO28888.1 ribonuclease P protein subunit p29, putative [Plasmodium knowlesi strain H]VVS78521.1 ribonuclease P protein subunit p29, putative [Plasmodium knowlesi strain 